MNSVNDLFQTLSQNEKQFLSKNFGVTNAEEFEGWLHAIPVDDLQNIGLSGRKVSEILSLRKKIVLKNTRKRSIGYNIPDRHRELSRNTEDKKVSFLDLKLAKNGVDFSDRFLKVKDQGNAPSCTGFASASAVEFLVDFKHEISGGFIYNRSKKIDGNNNAGSYLYSNLKAMNEYGICREVDHPYHIPTLLDEPTDKAINNAKKIKLIEHEYLVDPNIVQWIINMLDMGYVVVVGAYVYDSSWFNEYTERTGKIFEPLPGENPTGGHAIVITGYYDDKEAPGRGFFIYLNSWSDLWASDTKFCPAGFGILSFKYAADSILEAYTIQEIEDKWHENSATIIKIPQTVWYTVAAAYILVFVSVLAGLMYLSSDLASLGANVYDEHSTFDQVKTMDRHLDSQLDNNSGDLNKENEIAKTPVVDGDLKISFEGQAEIFNKILNLLSEGTVNTSKNTKVTKDTSIDFKQRSQLLKEIQSELKRE